MLDPAITLDEAKAGVAIKTAPRITEDSIRARIADVTYINHGTMTICVITMVNGFKSVGKAAPVSKANYDTEVGGRYAYEDAFKPLWALEAYLLLEKLSGLPSSQG